MSLCISFSRGDSSHTLASARSTAARPSASRLASARSAAARSLSRKPLPKMVFPASLCASRARMKTASPRLTAKRVWCAEK